MYKFIDMQNFFSPSASAAYPLPRRPATFWSTYVSCMAYCFCEAHATNGSATYGIGN